MDDGEPAVITLAMEPRDDDHYLSAVNHDEDADKDDMAFMPQDLRYNSKHFLHSPLSIEIGLKVETKQPPPSSLCPRD